MPAIVNTLVESLPRSPDDDEAFNIHLDDIVHESFYLSGIVKKYSVQAWLRFLVEQPHHEVSSEVVLSIAPSSKVASLKVMSVALLRWTLSPRMSLRRQSSR